MTETLERFFDNKLNSIHTMIPAKIVEYYGHGERKCKVKPLVKLRTAQNQLVEIKPIDDVPVIFPGTVEVGLLFPIRKDDGVMLIFSECSLGNFLNGSGEVDADDMSRFTLADCVAVPGLWSFKDAPDLEIDEDSTVLKYLDSYIEISKDGEITIDSKSDVTVKCVNAKIDASAEILLGGDNATNKVFFEGTGLTLSGLLDGVITHTHDVPQSPSGTQVAAPSSSLQAYNGQPSTWYSETVKTKA